MHTLRQFIPLFTAFTLGAFAVEIHNTRERAADLLDHQAQVLHLHQEIADLRIDIEVNYLDGYRHGATENHIEEDDPRWDCRTMGNRKCGTTEHPVMATPVAGSVPSWRDMSRIGQVFSRVYPLAH